MSTGWCDRSEKECDRVREENAQLKAEKETWGNEYSAVIAVKQERDKLKSCLERAIKALKEECWCHGIDRSGGYATRVKLSPQSRKKWRNEAANLFWSS